MGEGGPGASEPGDHPSACGQVGGPLGPGLLPAPRPPSPGSQGPEKSSVSSAVRPGPPLDTEAGEMHFRCRGW